jgi:hypothetical protein
MRYFSALISAIRFTVTEVSLVMDRDDSSGSQSEDEDLWNSRYPKVRQDSATRSSVHGLQAAISDGWLVQRGREMCSFAHDRYRQAAELEANSFSNDFVAKMSYRILTMMLHAPSPDIHQIAERARKYGPSHESIGLFDLYSTQMLRTSSSTSQT